VLLSVVITSFNKAGLLVHAVQSVLAQLDGDGRSDHAGSSDAEGTEVVVVDDGSTDGSPGVLRALLASPPASAHAKRVRIIEQANAGPGAARNAGVRAASGQYVLFLDGDDLLLPGALEVIRAAIGGGATGGAGPAVVAGGPLHADHDEGDPGLRRVVEQASGGAGGAPVLRGAPTWLDAYAQSGCFLGAGGLCVRREVLLGAGGFPEHRLNSEDIDTQLRIGNLGPCVVVQRPPVFVYRHASGSASSGDARTLAGWREIATRYRAGLYARTAAGEPPSPALDAVVVSIIAQQTRAHARRLSRQGDHALAWAMFKVGARFSWRAGARGWVVRYAPGWLWRCLVVRAKRGPTSPLTPS
jgi:glycosyltransferase involved in cell wall biosynthesis